MTSSYNQPLSRVFRFLLMAGIALFVLILRPASLQAQSEYYHLIAGSFDDLKSANDLVTALKAKGQSNALILFPSAESPKYRVSVYYSASRQEVQTYANSIRNTGGKSYWILVQKDPKAVAASSSTAVAASAKNKKPEQTKPGSMTSGKAATPTAGPTYHLVVGSFDKFETANQSMSSLVSSGFEPYIIYPSASSKAYKVGVYYSKDRKEVQTYSGMLKKRGKNPGWIYEDSEAAPSTKTTPATSTRLPAGSTPTYHLIAGSYDRFEQASEFADAMKAKGMQPLIMFPEPGISDTFRVSVYRSTSKTSVESYKKQKALSKAWIFEQK
ncbi:MAG: SPOR domain-containing protein [Bacteroidetes bacterium]|nr:MAG: SPOR domain-containing protein [Bacteroidota bacterium]